MPKPPSKSVWFRVVAVTAMALVTLSSVGADPAWAAPREPQAGAVAGSPGTPHQLHVVILDGEGALNNIKERTAREPIVQIQDENHKPVSEAAVVFLIQGNGGSSAGGAFANGLTSFTTTTGADGVAKAPGLAPNSSTGTFTIVVTATIAGITASSIIHQTNVSGGGSHLIRTVQQQAAVHPHLVIVGGVVAGAAIVTTVVAVTVLSGSSSTTITTGTTTVGPPPTTTAPGLTLHFGRH